jgi:formate dehydrogenase subunit gamma
MAFAHFREEPISVSRCPDRLPARPHTILRFVATERLLHWAIAIPFLGCFVSAVVLVVVYNPDPTRAYRDLFAWMHRGCGAGLILCPSLVLLASVRHVRIHVYNIRQAWVWRFDDIRWLALMGPAALSKHIILPDQGKFNAAEKLNFMMVMVFPPLFIATGILIWFPDITRLGAFGPWMVHCGLAALAAPLVLGHIIMATINPSTRVGLTGMVSGLVSREWAAHHYARWFREQFPHLVQELAGENRRDAGVTAQAIAGTDLSPQPATVEPLAFEMTRRSPVLAAGAPLGNVAFGNPYLGESMVRAPWITRAAEHEIDLLRGTYLLAGTVADAVAGIHEPGLAVDDAEGVVLRAGSDARAPPDAASCNFLQACSWRPANSCRAGVSWPGERHTSPKRFDLGMRIAPAACVSGTGRW